MTGIKNWEAIFEEQLIPLVRLASDGVTLATSMSVVIDQLFHRAEDEANKLYFRQVLEHYVVETDALPKRVEAAVQFLRMVKKIRISLAEEAQRKLEEGLRRDSDGMAKTISSDLSVVAEIVPEVPPPAASFEVIFDGAVCSHLRQILAGLACSAQPSGGKLPFVVAPDFGEALETVLRRFILGPIRAGRSVVSNLRDNYDWAEGSEQIVLNHLVAEGRQNAILLGWDQRWQELSEGSAGKGMGKHVWAFFQKHADSHGYTAPGPGDLPIFLSLPRYSAEMLRTLWSELEHYYKQEFDQAGSREGLFRDSLNKLTEGKSMPAHLVEWMSIKASIAFPKLGPEWLKKFSRNKGRNAAERLRYVPYLAAYLGDT